jgi:hypothetical protein
MSRTKTFVATVALSFALTSHAADNHPQQQPQNQSQQARHGDWLKDGEFKGKKLLIACWYSEGSGQEAVPLNNVPKVLRQLGFTVDILRNPTHLPALDSYDQLWLVSGAGSQFAGEDVARVKKYLAGGKGVYVLADNTPYTHEANILGKELHGLSVSGDYSGGQTVNVMPPGTVKKMFEEAMKRGDMEKLTEMRRAGFLNGKLYAEDHELLSGISQIYEGITLCHLDPAKDVDVILRASDNQSLVGVSTRPGEKLVYDCGFTRLYCGWEANAATSTHWYRNVAAFLLGKRRVDLPNG